MRIRLPDAVAVAGFKHPRGQIAFTLTEIMISSSLLTMVLAGVITCQLFGMNMYQLAKAKMGASDDARQSISRMVDEIRSSKILKVGGGDLSTFTQDTNGAYQKGSALQIYATTNTNYFVRYYWDSTDKKLKRTTNGSSYALIVANSISNQVVFTEEDFRGNIVTNNLNNRVVGITLQFYQIAYPVINIGPGGLFDFYQLRSRVTRRVLE